MTLPSATIAKVQAILNDLAGTYHDADDLLDYYNAAQREIVRLNPPAYTVRANKQMVAGTRQTLAADELILMDIVRNMGTDGTRAGKAVKRMSRQMLNDLFPDWHSATPSTTTRLFAYEPGEFVYDIYPPASSTPHYLEVLVSKIPPTVATGDTPVLGDEWEETKIDYMLFRALSKEAENGDPSLAAGYFQKFEKAVKR